MIKINTNIETQVTVDLDVKGTDSPAIIEMRFQYNNYFIGFESESSVLIIPPLNDFLYLEDNVADVKLKAYIGEYHVTVWEDQVELTDIEPKTLVNEIKITSKLIESRDPMEPEITVRLKS